MIIVGALVDIEYLQALFYAIEKIILSTWRLVISFFSGWCWLCEDRGQTVRNGGETSHPMISRRVKWSINFQHIYPSGSILI